MALRAIHLAHEHAAFPEPVRESLPSIWTKIIEPFLLDEGISDLTPLEFALYLAVLIQKDPKLAETNLFDVLPEAWSKQNQP